MIFDPQSRQYKDRGRVIPQKEIRDLIEQYITEEKAEVDREASKVLAGTLALAAFFSFLRDKIKAWHSNIGVIAYGGRSQMNLDRWMRINEKVQKELGFLDQWQIQAERGFVATRSIASQAASLVEADASIPSGLETVVRREVQATIIASDAASRPTAIKQAVSGALADSIPVEAADSIAASVAKEILETARMEELIWGSLNSRGRMYADAIYPTYETSVKGRESDSGAVGVRRICAEDEASCDECVEAASEEYVGMDEIADIGTLTCMSNCRCEFEFSYLNVEPLVIERDIYA